MFPSVPETDVLRACYGGVRCSIGFHTEPGLCDQGHRGNNATEPSDVTTDCPLGNNVSLSRSAECHWAVGQSLHCPWPPDRLQPPTAASVYSQGHMGGMWPSRAHVYRLNESIIRVRKTTVTMGNTSITEGKTALSLGNTTIKRGKTKVTMGNSSITRGKKTTSLGSSTIATAKTKLTMGNASFSRGTTTTSFRKAFFAKRKTL
ncbi:hypothetical protein DPEC_G00305770 [Dallia pectoralis]|uniref:Uncharacterized protein n=1 Tax=Dallia pectoralis TaxID=75939 RepID=A0ACC2FDV9_DALPE|nr:hypothetical protein DPEC_G00305770 [Dallia pectoralis]